MARETTPTKLPDGATGAVAEAPAKPAARRVATTTTPTAPLGRAVIEPFIEQIDEGGDTAQDVQAAPTDPIDDRDWLTQQLRHLIRCPIDGLPFHAGDGEPSRSTRIDVSDTSEPRSPERPFPRKYRVIQCNQCGARARVALPRNFDEY